MTHTSTQPAMNPKANWGRPVIIRLLITALGLTAWFWTQSLIGQRTMPASGIGDGFLDWTSSINLYLYEHHDAANALLIVSSGVIDMLGLFLLGKWIFGPSVRPFLGLLCVLGLRQMMQALVALPIPENAIWHYPGFPSLLVTYGVANDYFFSGHTSIAVLGATELARNGRRWVIGVAVLIAIFEAATVLVLRAHYTMDVFTGAIAALLVASLVGNASRPIDRLLSKANHWQPAQTTLRSP
jgi:hypothetical protein